MNRNEKWCMACDGLGYITKDGKSRLCTACNGHKTVVIPKGDKIPYKRIAKHTRAVMKLNEKERAGKGLLVSEDEAFEKQEKAWKQSQERKNGFSFDEWLRIEKNLS